MGGWQKKLDDPGWPHRALIGHPSQARPTWIETRSRYRDSKRHHPLLGSRLSVSVSLQLIESNLVWQQTETYFFFLSAGEVSTPSCQGLLSRLCESRNFLRARGHATCSPAGMTGVAAPESDADLTVRARTCVMTYSAELSLKRIRSQRRFW